MHENSHKTYGTRKIKAALVQMVLYVHFCLTTSKEKSTTIVDKITTVVMPYTIIKQKHVLVLQGKDDFNSIIIKIFFIIDK